ncbi:hypothetical protein BCR35DRAFT_312302 [Leucosporidium creatinivorum]|uniref:Uncharacterized protein n=1 Tax=Leucosporidium creatinivorum TaxID=106004 RepID=A0A1Y2G0Q2_9BASI|nr:hypothetical protein BCR35DRAFT_312302 [Leucosporidium creatinivorum]
MARPQEDLWWITQISQQLSSAFCVFVEEEEVRPTATEIVFNRVVAFAQHRLASADLEYSSSAWNRSLNYGKIVEPIVKDLCKVLGSCDWSGDEQLGRMVRRRFATAQLALSADAARTGRPPPVALPRSIPSSPSSSSPSCSPSSSSLKTAPVKIPRKKIKSLVQCSDHQLQSICIRIAREARSQLPSAEVRSQRRQAAFEGSVCFDPSTGVPLTLENTLADDPTYEQLGPPAYHEKMVRFYEQHTSTKRRPAIAEGEIYQGRVINRETFPEGSWLDSRDEDGKPVLLCLARPDDPPDLLKALRVSFIDQGPGSEFGIFRDWLVLALRFGLVFTMDQYVHTKAFFKFMLTRVAIEWSLRPGARLHLIAASKTAGDALNAVEELNAVYSAIGSAQGTVDADVPRISYSIIKVNVPASMHSKFLWASLFGQDGCIFRDSSANGGSFGQGLNQPVGKQPLTLLSVESGLWRPSASRAILHSETTSIRLARFRQQQRDGLILNNHLPSFSEPTKTTDFKLKEKELFKALNAAASMARRRPDPRSDSDAQAIALSSTRKYQLDCLYVRPIPPRLAVGRGGKGRPALRIQRLPLRRVTHVAKRALTCRGSFSLGSSGTFILSTRVEAQPGLLDLMKRSCKLLRVDYKGEVMYGVVICWYHGRGYQVLHRLATSPAHQRPCSLRSLPLRSRQQVGDC